MIKMTIGGEEVVSNKEFTINEEMLSASSTILNNCFPKSWEDNKDYVSNFYFPKDYSKFLLGEGEFLHGLNEYAILTESGSNPFYTTNIEKEWNSLNVYGNTYQETRSGKNLFNKENVTTGMAINRNTGQELTTSAYSDYSTSDYCSVNPNTQYYLGIAYSSSYYGIVFYDVNKNYLSGQQTTKAFTTPANTYYIRFTWKTADYDINTLQLEQGSQATSYEPFGVMPSPDFPSELVSVGYENLFNFEETSSSGSGLNSTIKGTHLTVEGTATSASKNITGLLPNPYKAGNYIFSITEELPNPLILRFYDSNNATIRSATIPKGSTFIPFTLDGTETQYRLIFNPTNATYYNFEIDLMLTKGTETPSYIPYGKYGIEIKNTGKNLFDGIFRQGARNSTTSTNRIYSLNNLKIEQGKTYTISTNLDTSIFRYAVNISQQPYPNSLAMDYDSGWKTTSSFTFTASTTGFFGVPISRINGANLTPSDIAGKWFMLEENSQATTYEAYKSNSQLYILDEPLRAIGDYKDRLFIQDGVLYIERIIKSVVFDGSSDENWSINSSGTINYSYRLTMVGVNAIEKTALSNYFIRANITNSNTNEGIDIWSVASGSQVRIRFGAEMTLANFKNWLSTHNTEVIYVLNEPTITPIDYVNIPNAYEGQNTTYLYTGLTTTMDVLYYWKNFNVLFAGVVKNTGDISLNPRYPHYCSLQILDYKTFLSESNTLDFVIANKTIREAITMVVNAVSGYGFVLGEININSANDIIGAYSTLNKTAYDVLQYLANISGSRWRARYVDSSTMAIDFYDPNTLPQGANIEYTQQYWEDNNIVNLTFNYGTRDYRNKQILLSDEVYANINYNETLISNGYSNTFTLQNNVGTIVNILIGNEEKTFATTNDKQMGVDADFYYAPGKNILESNSIYSAGTLIKITYQPLVKGRQIVYNSSEVQRISEQTDTEGIIARYENRNDILSSDELEKIAETYIEYKGKAEVILTLTTRNKDLYNIGEVVYFDAPIPDLKQNYMVKTKKTEYIVIDEIVNLFYIYEMTSSFNSEKAINYFDNQRNKANGNISSGDSITRNIDIETDVNIIWNNGSISSASITINGDNELNSILNSPFID